MKLLDLGDGDFSGFNGTFLIDFWTYVYGLITENAKQTANKLHDDFVSLRSSRIKAERKGRENGQGRKKNKEFPDEMSWTGERLSRKYERKTWSK